MKANMSEPVAMFHFIIIMVIMMVSHVNGDALSHLLAKENNISPIPWSRNNNSTVNGVLDIRRGSRMSVLKDFYRRLLPRQYVHHHIRDNIIVIPESISSEQIWPALELNWRVAMGTVVAFVGGSLGCAGGIGGGGIFVPMLVLIIGFDQKSATALSKCMIMGASLASVWYNFRLKSPILDYDLALVFQPMLMLGISIGVIFNVIFPNWIVTILLLVLFVGTSIKSFVKAISLYKRETIENEMLKHCNEGNPWSSGSVEAGGEYAELEPHHFDESNSMRRNWKSLLVLGYVWISFLVLQIVKNYTRTCSSIYWILNILQVPIAASVFLGKAFHLHVKNTARVADAAKIDEMLKPTNGNIKWSMSMLCMCALIGLLAGTVGGMLGLGGGFILAPVYLEMGVPPEIGSATASFVMLFSSSMSVIQYQLLHRFPLPFALYLFAVNMIAGFWAQIVLRRIIIFFRRASMIIFVVSFVIFVSAICLGGYGILDSLDKLQAGDYMGFVNLCTSS